MRCSKNDLVPAIIFGLVIATSGCAVEEGAPADENTSAAPTSDVDLP